jgi:hypothetical protein
MALAVTERRRRSLLAHHKEFQHSTVNVGSLMRSTGKMILAGWLIDKLALKEPLHRTFAYAAAGIGISYVESILRKRKDQEPHGRGH